MSSTSTEDDEEEDDGDDGDDDGLGGFRLGIGRLSWNLGGSNGNGGGGNKAGEDGGYIPTDTDFERNFGDGVDNEEEDDEVYYDADGDDEMEQRAEEPLLPGLYRAVYAFEPEGIAEMALEEDQIVKVIGRGGGVGWAVVDKGGPDGGHALVPEGYLEIVRLDGEEEDDEGGS